MYFFNIFLNILVGVSGWISPPNSVVNTLLVFCHLEPRSSFCWSCTFLFLTKRIDRFMKCIPNDWNDGYDNVVVCCTIENQKNADYKLSIFKKLPIKHKCITAQPLLEKIDIEKYLDDIELVVVGGESDFNARPFNYDWALSIREQCIRKNVDFEFRQCGTYTIKDGKQYKIQTKDLAKQAKLANINYKVNS